MDSNNLLMTEMMVCERHRESVKVSCPADSYAALKRFTRKRQEHFIVLTLDGSHSIIGIRIVSIGLVNRTVVHSREVFTWAIKDNSVAIILAHNHPSGKVDPSPEDREITQRLVQAGQIVGIEVLDHLIISKLGYFSFLEHGLLEKYDIPDCLKD